MADKTADRSVKAKKPAATNRIFLSSPTDHRNTETPIAWGKALYATRPPLPPHSKIQNLSVVAFPAFVAFLAFVA